MLKDEAVAGATPRGPGRLRERAVGAARRAGDAIAPVAPLIRVLLWIAALYLGYRAQMRLEDEAGGYRALWYFVLATALLGVATAGWPHTDAAGDARAEARPGRLAVTARGISVPLVAGGLLIAALGLGIAFRFYKLGSEPSGVWFDEAQNGLIARDILHGDWPPIFIGGFTQLPSAFFYIYALAAKIFGEGIFSLRLVSTIGGLLALPMTFLLAREYFGWRVASIATFLLAVMRWQINFSRFGVTNIWAGFFALTATYFFARAIRGGRRWNLVVSGLFLGMAPYAGFYGIFAPFVIGLLWLHSAFFDRVLSWRAHALAIVIVAVTAIAVYSPVVVWGMQHRDRYTSRPDEVLVVKGKSHEEAYHALVKSAKQHILMFNSRGDGNARHNIPGEPMLDTFMGIFFVLGLGMALLRIRRTGYFLAVAWLVIFLQNGIWSTGAPQAFRTSPTTPAIAMLAALPLAALWRIAADAGGARAVAGSLWRRYAGAQELLLRGGVTAGIAVLLSVIAYQNYDTFFNKQVGSFVVWSEYGGPYTDVGNEMERLRGDRDFFLPPSLSSPVLEYLYTPPDANAPKVCHWEGCAAPSRKGFMFLSLTRDLPFSGDRDAVAFLEPAKQSYIPWLRLLYPGISVREILAPGPPRRVSVYEVSVPGSEITALRGLNARYTAAGAQPIATHEASIDHDWAASAPPLTPPFDAHWSGVIKALGYAQHTLTVVGPGAVSLSLDGGKITASGQDRAEWTGKLYNGDHPIQVDAHVGAPGLVQLLLDGQPAPASRFFSGAPIEAHHGLMMTGYRGTNWSGTPFIEQLDPFVGYTYSSEYPPPYSLIWRGQIDVPQSGDYAFQVDARDRASLTIDGQQVIAPAAKADGKVALRQGRHDIEMRFSNSAGYDFVYLRWQPPGGALEVVPAERLYPPP